jgi:hypothetical protein
MFRDSDSKVRSSTSHLFGLTHLMPQMRTFDGEYYIEKDPGSYNPCFNERLLISRLI